jgi:5-oxoprolinase (ATP-hydrolysing)/N-methylhydantoinase A
VYSDHVWPRSCAANTSFELFETRVPVLVLVKQYVPDTGGPGRHRGGLGQVVRVRKGIGDMNDILRRPPLGRPSLVSVNLP